MTIALSIIASLELVGIVVLWYRLWLEVRNMKDFKESLRDRIHFSVAACPRIKRRLLARWGSNIHVYERGRGCFETSMNQAVKWLNEGVHLPPPAYPTEIDDVEFDVDVGLERINGSVKHLSRESFTLKKEDRC